jgi:hypothetical protein
MTTSSRCPSSQISYATPSAAVAARQEMRARKARRGPKKKPASVEMYHCPLCSEWHLGRSARPRPTNHDADLF